MIQETTQSIAAANAAERQKVLTSHSPWWHIVILLTLMAAQIACGTLTSVSSSDTNRDIYFAQQIASGQFFPLTGPDINGVMHLGPLWFYILAPILWIFPNAAAVTGVMSALSALQFPLAYKLGTRFCSRTEGLLFALMLAIPSWAVVSFGALTHTIVVVPAILTGALAALSYRAHPDWKHAALMGLVSAFMLTAHPTLVLLAIALILWAAGKAPQRRFVAGHGILVLLPVLLSLAPMVYEQWQGGFADFTTTSRYAQSEWSFPSVLRGVQLIYAVVMYAPAYLTHFWLRLNAIGEHVLMASYITLLSLAMVGLFARFWLDAQSRILILVIVIALVIDSIFLSAIRSSMPPWMVYALCPLIAALGALGLSRIVTIQAGAILVMIGLVVTTGWTFTIYFTLIPGSLDHLEIKPSQGRHGLLDIREYEESELTYRLARVPFLQVFALGENLCQPVTLFGHYAYLVDYTFAVGAAQTCGTTKEINYGGMPQVGRKSILGLHKSAWNSVHMKPEYWLGSIGMATPVEVWYSPVALTPLVPRLTSLPRGMQRETSEFTVTGDADINRALLVGHRAHRYASFEVIEAKADGKIIKPVYSDATTVLYLSPDVASHIDRTHWEISIRAIPDYVDVLLFKSKD